MLVLASVLTLVATACPDSTTNNGGPKLEGSKGGTLKLIAASDVDFIDPGQTYVAQVYGIMRVVHRTLMTNRPLPGLEGLRAVPDISDGEPKISADGSEWTFKIKKGVKFGPPVNRQVTSRDVKYGIERVFTKNVGGQYTKYLTGEIGPAVIGAAEWRDANDGTGSATGISGITTPDDETIVFKLAGERADFGILLAMPAFAPVPEDYAKPHDAKNPSTYGEHQVATGPYTFKADASGNIKGSALGWDPGKKLSLVRNPAWDASTDSVRKAFPDAIELTAGFEDGGITAEKILAGEYDVNWDTAIPGDKVQQIRANAEQSKRLTFPPSAVIRYVSLNTTLEPFTNVHVRRAVAWVLNKDAMRKPRGGAEAGEIIGAALPPGVAGYEESGGKGFDPYKTENNQGDVTKALAEMKLAKADGVTSIGDDGKYTGPAVLLVYSSTTAHEGTMNQVAADLEKIGIRTTRRGFDPDTMYTQWAQVPAKKVAVLTSVAWGYDYPSPASALAPIVIGPGEGGSFPAVKNNNYALFNDADTNRLIAQANGETDPKKQAEIWGQVNERVMDQVPFVPWLLDASSILISSRVKNYSFNPMTFGLDLSVVAVQ